MNKGCCLGARCEWTNFSEVSPVEVEQNDTPFRAAEASGEAEGVLDELGYVQKLLGSKMGLLERLSPHVIAG
jgi:hypothetical protein